LAGSTIGIKIADGSYYPVLEESFTGTKRLTLTTVKDDQDRVQIDLYRGEGNSLGHAQYVGSLIIENIPPAPQGEPEIELILGINADGELTAEASDRSTGESQVFSIGIRTLAEGETYEVPEFEVEPGGSEAETEGGLDLEADTGTGGKETFDEVPLTGDTYPVSGADRRRVPLHHRAPRRRARSPALVAILVVLAIALLAALGYVAWRLIWGPPIPALATLIGAPGETPTEPAETGPEPVAATTAAAATASVETGNQSSGTQPAAGGAAAAASTGTSAAAASTATSAAGTSAASGTGVSYRIKRGDTLWDISSTYYRNPWLFPVIARANDIENPDLIIAGARIFIPEQ
jgi:nucleoid-associated protein YgaU